MEADMPGRLGRHIDGKDEMTVGELWRRVRLRNLDHEVASECLVSIGRPEFASRGMPHRLDVATADELLPANIENIGEVRFDPDLQHEPNGRRRVARKLVVLVNALADGSVEAD